MARPTSFFAQQHGRRTVLLLFLLIATAMPSLAQDGTGPAPEPEDGRTPRGALWRAAVLPGWGQIYNRQFYKLPFVYLGLGGVAAGAFYMNDRYLLYRHAYLYAVDPDQYGHYADEAAPFQRLIEAGQERLLRVERDKFRRNRDLLYVGIGLFYGLTVLDAYVNAHLLDFDVGDALSVSVRPQPAGLAAQLRFGHRPPPGRRFR